MMWPLSRSGAAGTLYGYAGKLLISAASSPGGGCGTSGPAACCACSRHSAGEMFVSGPSGALVRYS